MIEHWHTNVIAGLSFMFGSAWWNIHRKPIWVQLLMLLLSALVVAALATIWELP